MFQQNHANEQDAITNKFLLKSYSANGCGRRGSTIVGAFLGAQVNTYRHFAEAKSFVKEKDFRAAWLASHSDNKAITAPGVYQEVVDTRVANLMVQSSSLPDIDENGYVDRTELNMAIRSCFGNTKFNEFLEVNYNELELLSRTVTDRNNERSIGVLSMKLLRDRTYARRAWFIIAGTAAPAAHLIPTR